MITATRKRSWAAALTLAMAGVGYAGQARAADAGGPMAVVLDPRVDGGLTAEERARLARAVQESLRSQEMGVVPSVDVETILQGEPELRSCLQRDDACKERPGLLLAAKTVLSQSWSVTRGVSKAAPAKRAKKGDKAEKAEADAPVATWTFAAEVFNVPVGAVAAKDKAVCRDCTLEQAATTLGNLVTKVVLEDVSLPRGIVEITSEPTHSDVFVDGRKMGFTPYKRPAFAGKHDIAVLRTGFKTYREAIQVVDGKKVTRSNIKLVEGVDTDVKTVLVKEVVEPRPLWRKATGGVLIGAGLAAIAGGAVMLWLNGKCTNDVNDVKESAACNDIYATSGGGYALVGTGVIALVGGIVTAALPGKHRQVEVKVGGLGSGYGIQFAGAF